MNLTRAQCYALQKEAAALIDAYNKLQVAKLTYEKAKIDFDNAVALQEICG